mgnify:CR=1 FL=1
MPKSRNPVIQIDTFQAYFNKPYIIDLPSADGQIVMKQPRIRDLIELGEDKFYGTISIFTTNTTAYRLPLWDAGYDWNIVSDFELFLQLYGQINFEVSKLIFGDLDFSLFELYQVIHDDDSSEIVMKHSITGDVINEEVYHHICQYLRMTMNMHPQEKLTDDPILKEWFIEKDRGEVHNREIKGDDNSSAFFPIISACINHPGFKYNIDSVQDLTLFQFFDSVSRLQIYESTTALLKGMYSGFVDTSKIPNESFNFMRETK